MTNNDGYTYICTFLDDSLPHKHQTITTQLLNTLPTNAPTKTWIIYTNTRSSAPRNKSNTWPNRIITDKLVCFAIARDTT